MFELVADGEFFPKNNSKCTTANYYFDVEKLMSRIDGGT